MEEVRDVTQDTVTKIEDQDAADTITRRGGDTDAALDTAALMSRDENVAQKQKAEAHYSAQDTATIKSEDINEVHKATTQKEHVVDVGGGKIAAQKTAVLKTTVKLSDKNTVQKNTSRKIFDEGVAQKTSQKEEDNVAAQNTKTQMEIDKTAFKRTTTPNALIIEDAVCSLSHDELLEVTKSSLNTLMCCDSLLSDLPEDVMLEEVLSHIAVEHGQSITIFISREDEPQLKVIVPQSSSVRELKKAINRHFEMHQKRKRNNVKISWKYIWRTYDLSYDGIILDSDSSSIDEYNVTNKVTLAFKKKRRKKGPTVN